MDNTQASVSTNDVIVVGYYSNSQNGQVLSVCGVSHCICSGGGGHDSSIPKIIYEEESDNSSCVTVEI